MEAKIESSLDNRTRFESSTLNVPSESGDSNKAKCFKVEPTCSSADSEEFLGTPSGDGMLMKGERGKATDFSIAAIMAPRGPSFGHYHLQGIGGNATANTDVECGSKAFVATSDLDHRESRELFFILSSFF